MLAYVVNDETRSTTGLSRPVSRVSTTANSNERLFYAAEDAARLTGAGSALYGPGRSDSNGYRRWRD